MKEIEEVFDEEEGKVDVARVDLMLENDNVKDMHDLIVDSVPLNNKNQDTYTKLSDLTQKCKDVNDNNTLVSNPNDIDLTNFLKASVTISSRKVQKNSHESDLRKKIGSRKKKCQVRNKMWKLYFSLQCKSWK